VRIIYIATVLIVMAGSMASAQVGVGLNLYGGGGLSLPVSDLKSDWKTGFFGMAAVGFNAIPQMETAGRYAYYRYAAKSDIGSTVHLIIQEYGLDLRVKLSPPGIGVKPYALVGGGAAKLKISDDALNDLFSSTTKFYYSIGAGLTSVLMPKVNCFFEVRYTRISVSNGNIGNVPITVGLNLSL
jgi:opacity protein-like surface antigen